MGRRRVVAGLLALAAVLVIGFGAALLAGVPAPWAVAQAPGTIYVLVTPEPGATADANATETPGSAATPTDTSTSTATAAAADATATVTATSMAPPATAPPATPRPVATPTPTAGPLPNLYFGMSVLHPISCGVPFTYRVWVLNDGAVSSPPSSVRLEDTYSGHSAASATKTIGEIEPGVQAPTDIDFTITSGCGEAHVLVVMIDPDGLVLETDETDNLLTFTYTPIHRPNLYPTDLTIISPAPCHTSVPVRVRVRNNGTVATPHQALVRFTDTYSGASGYSKSVYVSLPVIPAGGNTIVEQNIKIDSYCGHTHTMTATVDSNGEIVESNEGDNSMTKTYSVST
jgi:hypothetical protein